MSFQYLSKPKKANSKLNETVNSSGSTLYDSAPGVISLKSLQDKADMSIHSEGIAQLQAIADAKGSNLSLKSLQDKADMSIHSEGIAQLQAIADAKGSNLSAIVQRQDDGDEKIDKSWSTWFSENKTTLIFAGIVTATAAAAIYFRSGGDSLDSGTEGPQLGGAIPASPSSSGGGTASNDSDSGGIGQAMFQGFKSIFDAGVKQAPKIGELALKSMIDTLNGVGENVPPCPIDPTTGLPDLDAWGALLELAINVACKE